MCPSRFDIDKHRWVISDYRRRRRDVSSAARRTPRRGPARAQHLGDQIMSQDAMPEASVKPADDKKTTTIVVNATPHEVSGKEISYEQVVNLAYNNAPPTGPYVVITVTF